MGIWGDFGFGWIGGIWGDLGFKRIGRMWEYFGFKGIGRISGDFGEALEAGRPRNSFVLLIMLYSFPGEFGGIGGREAGAGGYIINRR